VPLVVGEDGERLAKRHGALSVGELRARGADPRAVVGLLAALSGLGNGGASTPGELVDCFALERVAATAAVLRREMLEPILPVIGQG
jgi:glutamyl-tRNA synthetase